MSKFSVWTLAQIAPPRYCPSLSIQQLINPPNRPWVSTSAANLRIVVAVVGHVDLLGSLLPGQALLLHAGGFGPQIAQVGLEVIDLLFALHGGAVAGQHGVKVQRS